MIIHPAKPWWTVVAGDVVLIGGTPHTIIGTSFGVEPIGTAYVEGLPPLHVAPYSYVQPVILEPSDAVATLAAAGLDPEIIDTRED